jgi:hypothetical protein
MICTSSTCESCCAGEPSPAGWLSESDEAAHPRVYEEDLVSIGCQGYAHTPVGRQEAPREVYRLTGRVVDVLFSGGKRVQAEIIRDSSDLINPFFTEPLYWPRVSEMASFHSAFQQAFYITLTFSTCFLSTTMLRDTPFRGSACCVLFFWKHESDRTA